MPSYYNNSIIGFNNLKLYIMAEYQGIYYGRIYIYYGTLHYGSIMRPFGTSEIKTLPQKMMTSQHRPAASLAPFWAEKEASLVPFWAETEASVVTILDRKWKLRWYRSG